MKEISKKEYKKYVEKKAPKSNHAKNIFFAFIIGGFICCIGEAITDIYHFAFKDLKMPEVYKLTTMTLIFIGALLTGIGIYDKIGFIAGAGSILPITGFANSVVSPAMEFNDEGVIFGIMCHLFIIAGPIIVSGAVSSIIVGLIYHIFGLA